MNKITTTLCAIAVAISASAATVNWQVNQVWLSGEDDSWEGENAPKDWLVYLFDANGTGTSRSDMLDLLAPTAINTAGGLESWQRAMGTAVSSALTASDSSASNSGATMAASGGEVSGYLVIIDADTLANASKAYVSEIASTKDTSPVPVAFDTFGPDGDGYVDARSGWYTLAPEPTSGLLLLLGLSGLALKRKNA